VSKCEHDWVVIERSKSYMRLRKPTGDFLSWCVSFDHNSPRAHSAIRRVCLKCQAVDDQIEEAAAYIAEKEAKKAAREKEEKLRLEQAVAIFNGVQMAKAAKQAAKGE
jgi:hypothetical protein